MGGALNCSMVACGLPTVGGSATVNRSKRQGHQALGTRRLAPKTFALLFGAYSGTIT